MTNKDTNELNFITHALSDAEKHLGIPRHAILSLLDKEEDDWSFIIKLSAVVEQLVNFLLIQNIEEEALKKLIQSQGFSKKIDLAKELDLIDKDISVKFKFIGNLRNDAAHNFTFKFFPNKDRLNSYKSIFADVWADGIEIGGIKTNNKSLTAENPKITLLFECLGCLSLMSLNQTHVQWKKEHQKKVEIQNAQKEIFEAFRKGLIGEDE